MPRYVLQTALSRLTYPEDSGLAAQIASLEQQVKSLRQEVMYLKMQDLESLKLNAIGSHPALSVPSRHATGT